jgi:histidinol-phosphate aminotransferase
MASSDSVTFERNQQVSALNHKYKDGTRLRASGDETAEFNGVWVPNDTVVTVVDLSDDRSFVLVRKSDDQEGWIRARNLSAEARQSGVTKGVVSSELVTPDPEYVKGIKIYNCGIKEDPNPGTKFGKGVQHLVSSQWVQAMSEFIASHFKAMQAFVRYAHAQTAKIDGFDYLYFTNMSNTLLNRADAQGLRTQQSVEYFLMATWLIMAAAEVDDFPFTKYTHEQRDAQRKRFYAMYLEPRRGVGTEQAIEQFDDAAVLERFSAPACRRDLIPPIALQRLAINNELSTLKYADATIPMRKGFALSSRMDSLKRHFESVHQQEQDEDHVIHLLWNFHAIYHVLVVFPHLNDLVDYSALDLPPTKHTFAPYEPTASLVKINNRKLPADQVLKLDWNEGVIPPPPSVASALISFVQAAQGTLLKWYPHLAGGEQLRSQLARYCNVIAENLLITNGSDDALILMCHAFLGHQKTVLAPVPTYEHFCVNAVGSGASLIRMAAANNDPFVNDEHHLMQQIDTHKPHLVYLVSPNNPTGTQWSESALRRLAHRYHDIVFLVDEAYYEFGAIDQQSQSLITCAQLAVQLPNVIVTRTFSKAFCLASVRCGYVIAHPNTIELLRAYYNPKSVNQFAQIAAYHALNEFDSYYRPYIHSTNASRHAFIDALADKQIAVRSGGAGNFVCIQVPDGKTRLVCDRLEEKAIFVRDISSRFPGYIRITIGLEMSRVVQEIIAIFESL